MAVRVEVPPAETEDGVAVKVQAGGETCSAKEAVTVVAALIATLHVPLPEHAPFQPEKVEPEAGVAVSSALAPLLYEALQALPQLMPPVLLVTVPEPVPDFATDRV